MLAAAKHVILGTIRYAVLKGTGHARDHWLVLKVRR